MGQEVNLGLIIITLKTVICFLRRFALFSAFPILCIICLPEVFAQENSWQSLAGEASAMSRKVSPDKIDYNLEVGPVLMKFKAGLINGYRSNLQTTNSGGTGSAYSTPSLTCNLSWPISDLNVLTFGVQGGYSYFWQASQSDSPGGFFLQPTSVLKGDFYVSNFKITPSDAFSLQQDPTQATELSGVSKLTLFQNNLGLLVTWDSGDFLVTGGASIFTVKSLNSSTNSYLDRNALSPSFSVQYSVTKTLAAGVNGSAQFNRYQSPAQLVSTNSNNVIYYSVQGQNNSNLFQVGPFVHNQISEYIGIDFDLGYLWGTYEKIPEVNQGGYPSTFYLDFNWSHTLNEYLQYVITANRIQQPSVSNGITFFTQWTFGFAPKWNVIENLSLSTPVTALIGEQSGSNGQKIQNYTGSINLGYQIMEKLSSTAGFTYLIKDSNQPNQSYSQWNASFGLTYDF
ncbi:hypothetical protein EBX31_07895 [bacterium]|nr:hypothetical protein [bacterium]